MPIGPDLSDTRTVAQIIQLAVAPVFLLNGIAILLSVFAGRLARLVDRTRALAEGRKTAPGMELRAALDLQRQRLAIVNRAIGLAATAAFLTCCAILSLFVDGLTGFGAALWPVSFFALALLAIIAALVLFLWEVRISGRGLMLELDGSLERSKDRT